MEFYKSSQVFINDGTHDTSISVTREEDHHKNCVLTQNEKFRKASLITVELASVASEASNIHFKRRLSLMKDLLKYWKEGKKVSINVATSDDDG